MATMTGNQPPPPDPAENNRRARLYDALWDAAYVLPGGVRLLVVGGHDTIDRLEAGGVVVEGLDAIEKWLTERPWR